MKITIPLPPITKKNSQRIVLVKNRPMIIPSKQYKDYEKACSPYMPKIEPINYPVNVKCVYYMPTRRKCDLTNLLEATDDILVKYGVLEDDNYGVVYSHDGSYVCYDKENPHTDIEITKKDL